MSCDPLYENGVLIQCLCDLVLNPKGFQTPSTPYAGFPRVQYPEGSIRVAPLEGEGRSVVHFWNSADPPALQPFIEVRGTDGSIELYTVMATGTNERRFRLTESVDAYDNVTQYEYDSSNRTTFAHRPDGITEIWNYDPTWVASWGANYSGVEVTYRDKVTGVLIADATYYMLFQKPGGGPLLGDKLFRVYRPKTDRLPALAGSPGVTEYGASAVLSSMHEVYEFAYTNSQIASIKQLAATSPVFGSTEIAPVTVASYTYATFGDRPRVVTEDLPLLEQNYSYVYYPDPLESSRVDRVLKVANHSGVTQETYLDDYQRPTKIITTPLNTAVGRPRASDTVDNGGLAEPLSITVEFEYGLCSSCVTKPTKITESPSLKVTEFDYDPITGYVLKSRVMNPSGGSQLAETVYTWSPIVQGDIHGTYKLDNVLLPDGQVWSHNYVAVDRPTPSGRLARGKKIEQQSTASPSIPSVGVLTSYVNFDTTTPPVDGFGRQLGMRGSVRYVIDESGTRTTLSHNAQGFLTQTVANSTGSSDERVTTEVVPDRFGRPVQVTSNAGSTLSQAMTIVYNGDGSVASMAGVVQGQPIETKFLYDRWGNMSVRLRKNVTQSGAAPNDFGPSPRSDIARPWLHDEFHYVGPRLVATLVDRRALDMNADGDLVDTVSARFQLTVYQWSTAGLLEVVGLPNGSESRFAYDGYGSLYKSESVSGAQVLLGAKYFVNNALEVVREVRGSSTKFVTSITRNPSGVVESVVEPTAGLPGGTWYTLPTTHAIHEFDSDIMGRTTEVRVRDGVSQALLKKVTFGFDVLGRQVAANLFDPPSSGTPSQIYTTVWEALDRQKKVIGPAGRFVERSFDPLGRVREEWDARPGNPNRVVYDYIAKTNFLGKVQSRNWDEHPGGGAAVLRDVEYVRDGLGRVLQIKQGPSATALVSSFAYYSTGQTESYTDPAGKVERYLPDAPGRLVERFLPGSQSIWNGSTYKDKTGTADRTELVQTDGRGRVTRTVFDFAGRTQFVMEPGSSVEPTAGSPNQPFSQFMVYDDASRLAELRTGDGILVQFVRDGMGRMLGRTSPTPALASMVSWLHGRDLLQRDALGRVTYSASLTGPGGSGGAYVKEETEHDGLDRVLSESFNFLSTTNWVRVRSTFTGGDPFRSGATLENGLAGNQDDIGAQFAPDAVGRMQQVSWQTTGAMRTVASYLHEGGLTRRRVTHWGANTGQNYNTDYRYDVYGRMDRIEQSFDAQALVEFHYDPASNLIKEVYNKHVTATTYNAQKGDRFAYDEHHRLAKAWLGSDQNHMNQASPEAPASGEAVGNFVKKLTYGLDAANNRTGVTSQLGTGGTPVTASYATDDDATPSNRYVTAEGVGTIYDQRGNTVFDGNYYYIYDEQNRLSEVYILVTVDAAESGSQMMLATDANTGSTSEVASRGKFLVTNPDALRSARASILARAASSLTEFIQRHDERAYAAQFKQVMSPLSVQPDPATTASSSSSTMSLNFTELQLVSIYMYDVHDRRVVRMVMGAGDTRFTAWDGWQEAEELQLTPAAPPTTPPTTLAVPQKQFLWGERLDELVAYRTKGANGWSEYFVAEGGAHCPQRILDSAGVVVEAQEYDAYGKTTFFGTASGEVSQRGNPFGWKAVRIDPETGLLYMRHRYYSAKWGRFLTQDPMGTWGDTLNVGCGYAYCSNRPLTLGDPMGLQSETGANAQYRNSITGNRTAWIQVGVTFSGKELPTRWVQVPMTKVVDGRYSVAGNDDDSRNKAWKELYDRGSATEPGGMTDSQREMMLDGAELALGMIPLVSEFMDAMTLLSPESTRGERVAAGVSLFVAVLTLGLAPSLVKSGKVIDNCGGDKVRRYDGPKPRYDVNEAHKRGPKLRPGKTPLPDDAADVFKRAVPDDPIKPRNWYGVNEDGQIYRFSGANDGTPGTAHFSGIDGVGDGIRNITPYALERLGRL